jgi:hypothetical protein
MRKLFVLSAVSFALVTIWPSLFGGVAAPAAAHAPGDGGMETCAQRFAREVAFAGRQAPALIDRLDVCEIKGVWPE